MKKEYVVKGLLSAVLALGALPVFAIALDRPPMPNGGAIEKSTKKILKQFKKIKQE